MNEFDHIERMIFLIQGELEGKLDREEQEELKLWLEKSEDHRKTFRRIKDKTRLAGKLRYRSEHEIETDWKAICCKTGISTVHRLWYIRLARYAAVFLGVCLGIWAYLNWPSPQGGEPLLSEIMSDSIRPGYKQAYIELKNGEKIALGNVGKRLVKHIEGMVMKEEKEGLVVLHRDSLPEKNGTVEKSWIVVPRGGEYQLILPDGTKVWLNSDTKLEFPNAFVGGERRVKLTGEAFFEVAKNKAMPFRVEVGAMEVVVLGTSFNIHAYDESIKTTLVEGSVEVKVEGNSYELSPGFEANVEQGQVEIVKSDVYEQIAWKEGKFVFRDKRLEEVMFTLSRWYDVEIFYQNPEVKDLHFTGNIKRHATIKEVLEFLERTNIVRFQIQGRTVLVLK